MAGLMKQYRSIRAAGERHVRAVLSVACIRVCEMQLSNVLQKRLSKSGTALECWLASYPLPRNSDPNAKHF